MKNFVLLFALALICPFAALSAQNNYTINNKTSLTAGVNFGAFSPKDINTYIEDDLNNNYQIIESYNTELYVNYSVAVGLSHKFNKHLEIKPNLEFSLAPKFIFISENGHSETASYSFNKISPGFLVLGHLPVGNGRNSIFMGGGLYYNMMTFKHFKANTTGYRLLGGFSLNNHKKFNPQFFLGLDDAQGEDQDFELNYTSFKIGAYFNF